MKLVPAGCPHFPTIFCSTQMMDNLWAYYVKEKPKDTKIMIICVLFKTCSQYLDK